MADGDREAGAPRRAGVPLVRVATMVKDEADVVEDWVEHHSRLFGASNVHVVDNMSTDGTWEALRRLAGSRGVRVSRHASYREKGRVMTRVLRDEGPDCEFVIPLDIDEFVVALGAGGAPDCSREAVEAALRNAPNDPRRPALHLDMILPVLDEAPGPRGASGGASGGGAGGAPEAGPGHPRRVTRGRVAGYPVEMKKKMFRRARMRAGRFEMDHGNHGQGAYKGTSAPSGLAVVHYHSRDPAQEEKKIRANMTGLGYGMERGAVETLRRRGARGGLMGHHYFEKAARLLDGRGVADGYAPAAASAADLDLSELGARLRAALE